MTASADTRYTDPGLALSKDKWDATYRPDQVEFLGMETERPPEPDRMVEAIWRALNSGPRTFNDRMKNWIGDEECRQRVDVCGSRDAGRGIQPRLQERT